MGGDGGTIPKRKDRVKTKSRSEPKSKYNIEGERDPLERWKLCPISGLPIRRPVMSGQWGHILSKEGVIEYLLKKRANAPESFHIHEDSSPVCDALHKMSDVIELKLKDNAVLEESNAPSEEKYQMGSFICPITGLETNGKYKFVFSWKCGCVISERALKECDNGSHTEIKKCLVCEKPYELFDLVLINPTTLKELEENQMKFMARKMGQNHKVKKTEQVGCDASSSDLSSISDKSSGRSHSTGSSTIRPSDSSRELHKSSRHRSPDSSSGRKHKSNRTTSPSSGHRESGHSRSSSGSSSHSSRSHHNHRSHRCDSRSYKRDRSRTPPDRLSDSKISKRNK